MTPRQCRWQEVKFFCPLFLALPPFVNQLSEQFEAWAEEESSHSWHSTSALSPSSNKSQSGRQVSSMLQNGGWGDLQSRSCKKSHTLARLLRSCGIHMDYGGSKILKNQQLSIENLLKGILSLFGHEVQIEVIITKSFVCSGKTENVYQD